jgi:hypothetical protein
MVMLWLVAGTNCCRHDKGPSMFQYKCWVPGLSIIPARGLLSPLNLTSQRPSGCMVPLICSEIQPVSFGRPEVKRTVVEEVSARQELGFVGRERRRRSLESYHHRATCGQEHLLLDRARVLIASLLYDGAAYPLHDTSFVLHAVIYHFYNRLARGSPKTVGLMVSPLVRRFFYLNR